jgi:hypothetical protein
MHFTVATHQNLLALAERPVEYFDATKETYIHEFRKLKSSIISLSLYEVLIPQTHTRGMAGGGNKKTRTLIIKSTPELFLMALALT